jgi:hypothetical protein
MGIERAAFVGSQTGHPPRVATVEALREPDELLELSTIRHGVEANVHVRNLACDHS